MSIIDMILIAFSNFRRHISNWLIIVLLSITASIITFGFSYYNSIHDFWNDWLNNSYDFRLYLVNYDMDNFTYEEIKKQLLSNYHVQDVFSYSEYFVVGTAVDFVTDDVNGETTIYGTIGGTKKIISGSDLSDSKYEVICPSHFLPKSLIQSGQYDANLEVNISTKIGEIINFEFFSETKHSEIVSMKLVGVYDENFDYSDINLCYTTHETVYEINKKHQPEILNNLQNIYILVDSQENISEIVNIDGIYQMLPIKTIRTEVAENVLMTTGIVMVISYLLTILIMIVIFNKKFRNEYKNHGLYLALGYDKKIIKCICNIESIMLMITSFILSLFLDVLILNNFSKIFLSNQMQLSKIDINLSIISLVINLFVLMCCIYISNYKNIQRIEEMNVVDVIRENNA